MGQLHFETLERLASALYIDFLVLIPTYMDIHRNETTYTQAGNRALDLYLGSAKWREHWPDPKRPSLDFGIFVAEEFCLQMQRLGFLFEGLKDLELVKMSDDKNQPLYHLAFFSKSRLEKSRGMKKRIFQMPSILFSHTENNGKCTKSNPARER
jgi:hypothetical protein